MEVTRAGELRELTFDRVERGPGGLRRASVRVPYRWPSAPEPLRAQEWVLDEATGRRFESAVAKALAGPLRADFQFEPVGASDLELPGCVVVRETPGVPAGRRISYNRRPVVDHAYPVPADEAGRLRALHDAFETAPPRPDSFLAWDVGTQAAYRELAALLEDRAHPALRPVAAAALAMQAGAFEALDQSRRLLKQPALEPPLREALDGLFADPDPRVRAEAQAAWFAVTPDAQSASRWTLRGGPLDETARGPAEARGTSLAVLTRLVRTFRVLSREAPGPLKAGLARETDPDRCAAAVDALREVEPHAPLPLLLQNLASLDPRVRGCAALVLASFPEQPDPDVLAALERAFLTDPDASVKRRAAVALLRRGDARGAEQVSSILHDEDPALRRAALLALARGARPAEQLPHWVDALDDEDESVREVAFRSLAEQRPPGMLTMLAQRIASTRETRTRIAAACALAELLEGRDLEAHRSLAAALQDPAERLRWFAGAALVRLGFAEGAEEMLRGLRTGTDTDRARLLALLAKAPAALAGPHLVLVASDALRPLACQALAALVARHEPSFSSFYRNDVGPRLIELLAEWPPAGELLFELTPQGPMAGAEPDAAALAQAWRAWWREFGPRLEWSAERQALVAPGE